MKSKKLKTLLAIGKAFNLHRNTVSRWFAKDGAPKREADGFDFAAVAAWVEKCAASETTMAKTSPQMAAAKLAEVLERVRKLSLANQIASREVVSKMAVVTVIREIAAEVKNLLYAKLENEYPILMSNDVAANRIEGRKLADEILRRIAALGDRLAKL